jgi:endo-beta-N-acetylglucosaminidase D
MTWDNGVKRGWCGPSHCVLCKSNVESVSHLFVTCPYAGQVTKIIKEKLNAKMDWNRDSLEDCFRNWIQDKVGQPLCRITNFNDF